MINHSTLTPHPVADEASFDLPTRVDRSDLQQLLASHPGNSTFEQALGSLQNGRDLLRMLSCYIYFNSIFGSGVANLAGEIGAQQSLFRDPGEPMAITADRSVEVAARIFFAAVDEFGVGGGTATGRSTHRTLAQATLKAIGSFFDYDIATMNRIAEPNARTLTAIDQVRDGYAISQAVDEQKIFRAIGFHMGSEVLADEEFNLLDSFLRTQHPDLVNHLKKTKVTINEVQVSAYHWIQIHTTVEADHFDAAMLGANLALRYYHRPQAQLDAKAWILNGFKEFAVTQADFMNGLMKS
jgi:hypothetical protein